MGALSGSVDASASYFPPSLVDPVVGALGRYSWSDDITITSATLASGTPVDFRVTEQLLTFGMGTVGGGVSVISHSINYQGGSLLSSQFVIAPPGYMDPTQCIGSCSDSESYDLNLFVGQTINLAGLLGLDAQARALALGLPGFSSTQINGAGSMFLDSLTPGASYITASGVTYASSVASVPESSTLILLAVGLVGLAAWRWKRAA